MAINTLAITADGNPELATITRRHDAQSYAGTIFIQGDLGSGTVVLQVSPDGGTTKYTVKDVSGNNISTTSAAYYNYVIAGDSAKNTNNLKLYVNVVGSTNPTLTILNYDNR